MHASLLTVASLAASAMALITPTKMGCLTQPPSALQKEVHQHLASISAAAVSAASPLVSRATVNVPVYVHVVSASNSARDGYLSVRALLPLLLLPPPSAASTLSSCFVL